MEKDTYIATVLALLWVAKAILHELPLTREQREDISELRLLIEEIRQRNAINTDDIAKILQYLSDEEFIRTFSTFLHRKEQE